MPAWIRYYLYCTHYFWFKILIFFPSLFFLIRLREAFLESKVGPTNCNISALLLHTSKTVYNVEFFSIFSQTFLKLIFATKIKTMLLKQSAVFRKYCVYYVSEHFKYCTQINEYWLKKMPVMIFYGKPCINRRRSRVWKFYFLIRKLKKHLKNKNNIKFYCTCRYIQKKKKKCLPDLMILMTFDMWKNASRKNMFKTI